MRDWEDYRYRETQRIALAIQGTELENDGEIRDRLAQLDSGIIFYPRRFFDALWWWVKDILLVRCSVCERRHWAAPYKGEPYSVCFFGIWYTLVYGLRSVLGAAQNGDD